MAQAQAQVEIVLAPDGVEGDVVGYDKSGKKVELPHKIVIQPYFFGQLAMANLAYVRVSVGKQEVNRSVVQLSGSTGKIKAIDRSVQQDPKFVLQAAAGEEIDEEEEYEEVEEEATEEEAEE